MSITKFVVFGERCSGTNFLTNVISSNFGLSLTKDYGHKHFFCFNNFDQPNEDVLFIGIIRNPIYWINSFAKELHHIPQENRSLMQFLTNKFYSTQVENNNEINLLDLNYQTLEKYDDIFQLRKIKNDYLINVMKEKVKNYILINYESLLYNYDYTLDFIRQKFNLQKQFPIYQVIKQYKGSEKYDFVKQRNILLLPKTVIVIWSRLNLDQENSLGYFKGNNNEYFKNTDNISFVTSF
jgi:hypothetical protein